MAEEREVEIRDGTAALEELREIAVVNGEDVLRPFSQSNPGFFRKLADRLRESLGRYDEIAAIQIEGEVDPEEGYPYLQVGLMMNASPERACEIRRALFNDWLRDLHLEAPLQLEVVPRPA